MLETAKKYRSQAELANRRATEHLIVSRSSDSFYQGTALYSNTEGISDKENNLHQAAGHQRHLHPHPHQNPHQYYSKGNNYGSSQLHNSRYLTDGHYLSRHQEPKVSNAHIRAYPKYPSNNLHSPYQENYQTSISMSSHKKRRLSPDGESKSELSPKSKTPQNSPKEGRKPQSILRSSSTYHKGKMEGRAFSYKSGQKKKVTYSPEVNIHQFNQKSPISRRNKRGLNEYSRGRKYSENEFREKSLEFAKSAKNLLGIFEDLQTNSLGVNSRRHNEARLDSGLRKVVNQRENLEKKIREFEQKILND